jgi:hypothetical protein
MTLRLAVALLVLAAGPRLAACSKAEHRPPTPSPTPAADVAPIIAHVEPAPPAAAPAGGQVRLSWGTPAGGEGRLDPTAFRPVLSARRPGLQACYDAALRRVPELAGELIFLLTILPSGAVEAKLERNAAPLEQAGLTACVTGELAAMSLAATPPTGGSFVLRLPISFERRGR